MRHAIRFVIPLVFATISARAQQSDEAALRQKTEAIKAGAAKLAESGRKEEALRLVALADELKALADPPGVRELLTEQELLLAELGARKKVIDAELQKVSRSVRNPDDPALQQLRADQTDVNRKFKIAQDALEFTRHSTGTRRRILHMRVAAEHLRQAGMFALTRKLLAKAAAEEQTFAEAEEKAAGKDHESLKPTDPQKNGEVEELRKELQKVRAELDEVRKQIKPN